MIFYLSINRLELSDGSIPLFKGGSEMKIDPTELRRIKVDIHRNIPGATLTNRQLQREIVNPEEVTLKRREGNVIFSFFNFQIFFKDRLRFKRKIEDDHHARLLLRMVF